MSDLPHHYILHKFKDLSRSRGVGSYCNHPLKYIFRIAALALSFLINEVWDEMHFNLRTTDDVGTFLRNLDIWKEKLEAAGFVITA